MTKNLKHAKQSVIDFIDEANKCAKDGLGFSALLTTFPVVLSISEALLKKGSTAEALFEEFIRWMNDTNWFLQSPSSPTYAPLSLKDIANKLYQVRHGLDHQLSLPDEIGMINVISENIAYFKAHPNIKYAISVSEFVKAVENAANSIIAKHPTVNFDPNPRGDPRSPAGKSSFSATLSSSSSPR